MTYHILLEDHEFDVLHLVGSGIELALDLTNLRPSKCHDCRSPLQPGAGIKQKAYKNNGYICLACAQTKIIGNGVEDYGYGIGIFEYLLVRHNNHPGKFTSREVAEAITKKE